MSAFWQALLAAQQSVPVIGPLRTLAFDDQDYTAFTYQGLWNRYQGLDWPGGATNNTVTSRAAVIPSETLPTITTQVIPFQGTADEGIDFIGAAEDSGQIMFFMRALDSPTTSGWAQFCPTFGTYSMRWDWKIVNRPDDRLDNIDNFYGYYQGQSYYNHLANPGLIKLRGLPAGRYQFMIQKPANTNDPNDNADKALYFDGANVYTCHPTFS